MSIDYKKHNINLHFLLGIFDINTDDLYSYESSGVSHINMREDYNYKTLQP